MYCGLRWYAGRWRQVACTNCAKALGPISREVKVICRIMQRFRLGGPGAHCRRLRAIRKYIIHKIHRRWYTRPILYYVMYNNMSYGYNIIIIIFLCLWIWSLQGRQDSELLYGLTVRSSADVVFVNHNLTYNILPLKFWFHITPTTISSINWFSPQKEDPSSGYNACTWIIFFYHILLYALSCYPL